MAKVKPIPLPEGIVENDKEYPTEKAKDKCDRTLGNYGSLTLYYTEKFGWCITTLPIGGRVNQFPARTYAITMDGKNVSVGGGPHVLSVIYLYMRKGNKVHKKLHDLYMQGASSAGDRRDRIGSRRIEGAEKRAAGRISWRWDA